MVSIKLGTNEYEIRALNMKQSRIWRETFGEKITPLIEAMAADIGADTGIGEIAKIIAALRDTLIRAPDICADALFAYAPYLPREVIEDEATDAEALDAFVEVLRLAYPFSALWTAIRRTLVQQVT